MSDRCQGVYAAILTPLAGDGAVDAQGLTALINDLLANGCDGIALFGTTGEATSFSLEEREHALEAIIDRGVPAARLIVGTGCCSVPDTIRLTRHAVRNGCAGVLMVPPFYFKAVTDEGLYAAFARTVEGVGDDRLRVYLYHFPEMTNLPLSRDLVGRLHHAFPDQVVGIKDSSGVFENMTGLIEALPDLTVLTGDDDLLLPLLQSGGAGSITAGANIASPLLARIYAEWRDDSDAVRRSHALLEQLWSGLLLKYPVTEALKELLAAKTDNPAWLRMRPPLVPLTEQQHDSLLRGFDAVGLDLRPSLTAVLQRP